MTDFTPIPEAIQAIADGKYVIVLDDTTRENEADLIIAAEKVTVPDITFMVKYTSGLITVPMTGERLDALNLPLMVNQNTEKHGTAFTVSVDYNIGTTTGISAHDRCATIRALANPDMNPDMLARPGHIFPLRYREGGVLKRAGHTEASIDLIKLAGLSPVGVICELIQEDGDMMRGNAAHDFAKEHNIPIISIAALIRYRLKEEALVNLISTARIPTPYGDFMGHAFKSSLDGIEHLALVKGDLKNAENVLVRVHSECLTGDILHSLRCDCGTQLQKALSLINEAGTGVLVYLRGHEGRGIGLGHKIRAYSLQDTGLDTVEANEKLGLPVDNREYGIGAQILQSLGVTSMKLMTNNPQKYTGLEGYDLTITERVPLITVPTKENKDYLQTKADKLGHLLQAGVS